MNVLIELYYYIYAHLYVTVVVKRRIPVSLGESIWEFRRSKMEEKNDIII